MQIKGLWLGGVMVIVTLIGCGSSGGTGGTGGSTGGGGTGSGKAGGSGSGKGGATGAFTTSVPAGTKVTALTSSQAAQLCNDIQSYYDNSFQSACQASSGLPGLEDAYLDLLQNPTASNSELQSVCASDTQDGGCSDFVDGGTDSCDVSNVPATCEATVGDYTTCVNDMTTADRQVYASLPSCSTLTAASLTALFGADGGPDLDPPEPTSCSTLYSTCDVDGGAPVTPSMSLRMVPKRRR